MATDRSSNTITTAGVFTLIWLGVFFVAVAWFLGPNILERRDGNVLAFFLHIGGGSIVLLTAPFQFIAPIRNRYRLYHRLAGYVFVTASVAAIVGYLMIMPGETDLFWISQLVAVSLWAACVAVAVHAIRRKHVLTHQHNMARAFVIAAYFVTARVFDQHLMWALAPFSAIEGARFAHSDWLAWMLPLIAVEIWFGRKWDRLLTRREHHSQVR
ncbi:MAG: DUF2306 domain-containing protein [Allosphingosinicella sp.]